MSDRRQLISELAEALEELRAFRPIAKSELAQWYAMARKVEASLVVSGGLSPDVPSLLWNYLADADIRFKDSSYAELQDRQMRLLSRYLGRGEIPTDEALKESS